MSTDTALALPRPVEPPVEILPAWLPAQRVARLHAREPMPSIAALRAIGHLPRARAERIAAWYTGPLAADPRDIDVAYGALADELVVLARAITAPVPTGGLGVRITLVPTVDEPYGDAADLCADLRAHGAMQLRAASADQPHPLLADASVDHLRLVHDVLGHAALGLGFDLQSEYAAWLFCRNLFSPAARPAAFTELVGAVTAYVLTGAKQPMRADLPGAI